MQPRGDSMKIIIPPNAFSEWYDLVKDTQAATGVQLDDHVASYLILTLDRFVTQALEQDLPLAIEYLQSMGYRHSQNSSHLRTVGDRCLILSGFFPERAHRFNVSLNYFANIGRQAYLTLADRANLKADPELFYKLGFRFMDLTVLLNSMRRLAANDQQP